ncbi:MAG: response regulator [Armatimonadetes bacterium]|nr:MAG: response regulator [Armatimonadota bacterium]
MSKEVLVVDDDESFRDLTKFILEDGDFKVEGVESGEEALEVLERERKDLILLDLMLPGMGGKEVAKRLRSSDRTRLIPLLLVTAYPCASADLDLKEIVDGVLLKPFEVDEFCKVVYKLVGYKE